MSEIAKSIHGREGGFDHESNLVVPGGFRSGSHGSQIDLPGPRKVTRFDDFTGGAQAFSTTIIDGWRSRKGSDGACVDWTVGATANGEVVGTIGSTTASMAVSGVQLDSNTSFRANMGELVFEARVKLSQITNIACFIGLTDQVAALEMPIHSAASANTITTNATDGVGFFFDTSMTDDTWWLAGVKADVDATHQNTAIAPVAATYATFRVEVSTTGVAKFFYNGKQIGTQMDAALTASVLLTPVIAGFNRTTSGTPTITADYVHAAANRA